MISSSPLGPFTNLANHTVTNGFFWAGVGKDVTETIEFSSLSNAYGGHATVLHGGLVEENNRENGGARSNIDGVGRS